MHSTAYKATSLCIQQLFALSRVVQVCVCSCIKSVQGPWRRDLAGSAHALSVIHYAGTIMWATPVKIVPPIPHTPLLPLKNKFCTANLICMDSVLIEFHGKIHRI